MTNQQQPLEPGSTPETISAQGVPFNPPRHVTIPLVQELPSEPTNPGPIRD